MARIALPDGDAPEIVRALTLVPDFAPAVGGYEKAVWGSSLDWRLHELVRMQVAIINECTVCLGWRTPQAIEAGVTDELLAGVGTYETFPDFTDTERVALEYAKHFCTDSARISDDLIDAPGRAARRGGDRRAHARHRQVHVDGSVHAGARPRPIVLVAVGRRRDRLRFVTGPASVIVCVDCGGRAHLVQLNDPGDPYQSGDVAVVPLRGLSGPLGRRPGGRRRRPS